MQLNFHLEMEALSLTVYEYELIAMTSAVLRL